MELNFDKTLPKILRYDGNGRSYWYTLSGNSDLKNAVFDLLKQHGYIFHPIERPIPAILVNWRWVSRNSLIRLLQNIYTFYLFNTDFEAQNLVVGISGFVRPSDASRLVCVEESANGLISRNFYLHWDEIEKEVERFFNLPNGNKIMVLR